MSIIGIVNIIIQIIEGSFLYCNNKDSFVSRVIVVEIIIVVHK